MAGTTLQDRVLITNLAEVGCTDRAIAQQVGWSRATVRKWRRRGQQRGAKGLIAIQGRPPTGALGTYPSAIAETLRAWRLAHPGWGPKTLRAELAAACSGQPLPNQSTIGRWLRTAGLSRHYERHADLPQPAERPVQAPHEEWEMDALGYQRVPDAGVVSLINLNDVYSKVKLLSYPCYLGEQRAERHPTTEDYQLVLRRAFSEWGLPDRLAVDRDSVFYDNGSKSPFPTRLHLWLLALGVTLTFGRPGQPTDQAITERSHQTWQQQVLAGQRFATWQALGEALEQRRDFLNRSLPCATLGNLPPLVAYPHAQHPRRTYRPEWEPELLDLTRVSTYLSQGRWFRLVSGAGTVALGRQVYYLGHAWGRAEVVITFDPTDQQLVFHAPHSDRTKRLPLQGVTPMALIGELGPLVRLDRFQLALPLSWSEWRVLQFCETLSVTT